MDLLRSVDWPDDESSIRAVFAGLPEALEGLAATRMLPEPAPGETGPHEFDGFRVTYGAPGSDRSVQVDADPGAGVTSPLHAMASMVVYSGGPTRCIGADHSPDLDSLFRLKDRDDLFQELRRITTLDPVTGELVWLICTMTFDGDRNAPLAEDDWRYVAAWSDAGWGYWVRAPSAALREAAVTALVMSVAEVDLARGSR